jgi:hypothetical protein
MVKDIHDHLSKFDKISTSDLTTPVDDLTIGENKINSRCFLHYISDDPDFMKNDQDKCSTAIKQYIVGRYEINPNFLNGGQGNLDLTTLLALSNNFTEDTDFYKNLYGFNLALANLIATDNEFSRAKYRTQLKILENFQEFIKQSLTYLSEYMNKYKVIDENLIKSSYDLLYLLNIIAYRRVNAGGKIRELLILYDKLTKAIENNINIYKKIIPENFVATRLTDEDKKLNEDIQKLIEGLKKRLGLLEKQSVKLDENSKILKNSAADIKFLASENIINIATTLDSQIKKLTMSNIISSNTKTSNIISSNTKTSNIISSNAKISPLKKSNMTSSNSKTSNIISSNAKTSSSKNILF